MNMLIIHTASIPVLYKYALSWVTVSVLTLKHANSETNNIFSLKIYYPSKQNTQFYPSLIFIIVLVKPSCWIEHNKLKSERNILILFL